MIVLTNDVRRLPDFQAVGDVEINAPAFCDPGSKDRSNGTRICTREDILRAIATRPLAFEPWTRPLYSNTGFNLLGWAVGEAASRKGRPTIQSSSNEENKEIVPVEDLLREDVFTPLEMNDTSFWVPPEKRDDVAVPERGIPTFIDWDFTSTFNPYTTLKSVSNVVPGECTPPPTISPNSSTKSF
jgi:CubicO group peptidase (beta-lactamase class C family)